MSKDIKYLNAQEKRNPKFLIKLLEENGHEINTIFDSFGDSLLIRDIKKFGCRHFSFLIESGADVNHCNRQGFAALHYAVNYAEDIKIIELLIKQGADVNKQNANGDTPLLLLTQNYGRNKFEKIKLLIESGADINLHNQKYEPALSLAVLTEINKGDLQMIKYLLDNNAKIKKVLLVNGSFINLLISSVTDADDIYILNYVIPVMDILINEGDDIFLKNSYGKSTLCNALVTFNMPYMLSPNICALLSHLIKIISTKLSQGVAFNPIIHRHPIEVIITKLHFFVRHPPLLVQITELICNHGFVNFPPIETFIYHRGMNWDAVKYNLKVPMSVVGFYLFYLPIDKIMEYLVLFKDHLKLSSSSPLYLILLWRFIDIHDDDENQQYLEEIFDFLLEHGVSIESNKLQFQFESSPNIPDCIWITAAYGKVEYLQKFLRVWKYHPMMILLSLRPWLEHERFNTNGCKKFLLQSITQILPMLITIGGPLSSGSSLFKSLKGYMERSTIERDAVISDENFNEFTIDRDAYERNDHYYHYVNNHFIKKYYSNIVQLLSDYFQSHSKGIYAGAVQ